MRARALRPAAQRSPSLARVALQVLVAALPVVPSLARADASVPGSGDKQPGKAAPPRPALPKPAVVEAPRFTAGVIAQPAVVLPAPPPPPSKKKAK